MCLEGTRYAASVLYRVRFDNRSLTVAARNQHVISEPRAFARDMRDNTLGKPIYGPL